MTRARSFETAAMAEGWGLVYGPEPGILPAARVGERFFTVLGTPMRRDDSDRGSVRDSASDCYYVPDRGPQTRL